MVNLECRMTREDIQHASTPAFLVNLHVVSRNCRAMRDKAQGSGVSFRPHVKTHKTLEIARMQHGGGVGPVTVSTLAEADMLAEGGFRDVTYAVPIAPARLERAAALARRLERLNILLDSEETLRAVESFHAAPGVVFSPSLKIDSRYPPPGADPSHPTPTH